MHVALLIAINPFGQSECPKGVRGNASVIQYVSAYSQRHVQRVVRTMNNVDGVEEPVLVSPQQR